MSGFTQARADLAEAMQKLAALDRVFKLMDEFAGRIAAQGQHPELTYDAATGRIGLSVAVGRVPPRVSVGVEEAAPALPPVTAPAKPVPAAKNAAPQNARLAGLRTGPWTDAELMTAAKMIREGRTNKEIAARLNRTATGIHFKLDPMRAELAEEGREEIPGETEGAITVEPEKPGAGSRGSRQPQADADATRVGAQAPEADEKAPAAAGGSPAHAKGPNTTGRLPPPEHFTHAQRRAWGHLDAIEDPAWPAKRDLEMVERMVRGDGAGLAAEQMGIPKAALVARWERLFPEKSVGAQVLMVGVLDARVAAEGVA